MIAKGLILTEMNLSLVVSILLASLCLSLGADDSSEKFILKKNSDNTYLLVPAPANASKETTVDIKSLPPIAVEGNTPRDAPGINSQSVPIAPSPGKQAPPPASGVKVST